MTMMTLTESGQPVSSGFRVDVSRGERIGRVSSEWFSRPDDERYRDGFLRQRGFSKSETTKIIETVSQEEGRPPESIFDFVQGITALARTKAHQDARLELEGKAKRLMERAI